ncbi:Photosystem I reaction center subunit V, chloroplastic, partial [Linum grandiflorum]
GLSLFLGRFVFFNFQRENIAKQGLPVQNGKTHFEAGERPTNRRKNSEKREHSSLARVSHVRAARGKAGLENQETNATLIHTRVYCTRKTNRVIGFWRVGFSRFKASELLSAALPGGPIKLGPKQNRVSRKSGSIQNRVGAGPFPKDV